MTSPNTKDMPSPKGKDTNSQKAGYSFGKGSGRSKKIEKTKISKRKADEEAAAKAAAEEQDAIRKSNEKTTKKKIKEAKKEARKKLAKKKQLERDTEENVSDNEEYDYQSDDVDNKEKTDEEAAKRKAELLAELQAIETRLEKKAKDEAQNEDSDVNVNENEDEYDNEEDENNEEDAANNEEDDENNEDDDDDNQEDAENEEDAENAEDVDNEEDADNEENSKQKKKGRKSKVKKEGKKMKKAEEENQVKSEEDVLYEGRNSYDERLPVCMEKKKKKRTKKAKSSTSISYMIKQSKNEIGGGENNDSEEEQEYRKLTKDKMDEGLENESEGDEQLKKVTKPKKEKGSIAEKQYPTCNTRSSPKPMYEAMMTLSDPQKKCLKDMGFERMIHFPIVELPSALAYHAIDHFHPGSMELRLEKGSIKATRQKVQEMLGIPMGSRKLEDLEQRPFNDPFIKEWENQFKHVKKPTPAAIASVISDSTQADFMFRMNFITLFGSTMGTLDNGGRVSTKLLKGITEDVDISEIDWCGYILDCLQNSKKNWKDVKTRKNFYYGPLTFLCLLYLDSTIFPDLRVLRHRPALRSWNTTTMRKRIKMETETRRLGKLEHHGEFNHEEEQDGINVYKGLDVYVPLINDKEPETKEEYYEKIVLKFDIISDERSELVKTLRNGVKKFEDDQMMIDFCKEYRELFNDNEFKHYEYSKDDDSEGETDGDNEDNNHDDDGAPTADANKKKESENQTKERNKEDIDKQTEESRSEGTDESGSEGTKENGSEATEGHAVIIDNSKTPMSYEAKYKKDCDVLKNMFSMYLKEVQHPKAKEVLNKKPTILRPKWGTKENNTDCGVFLMMHMENYNGENARN
ncbi:peptidase C48, SUMO/sentrin/Ubl1 [Tanacetum coccineum]